MDSRLPQPVIVAPLAPRGTARRLHLPRRLRVFAMLALIEIVLASALFGFPHLLSEWSNPVFYANRIALILLLAAMAFPLVAWPRMGDLAWQWTVAVAEGRLVRRVVTNLAAFIALLTARGLLAGADPGGIAVYWYWGYAGLVLATGVSLALVAAPVSFWKELPQRFPLETGLALAGSCLVLLAASLSKGSWYGLSVATLHASHAILTLYEPHPFIEARERILGADEFRVQIWAPCSGYEGIALIVVFLAIYLWVFRAHLKFPNALCLIPIGIAAIWTLNAVRIALLVSIGAHVSPAVALEGFHSWSGWIAFVAATVAIMVAAHRSALIFATPQGCVHAGDDGESRRVLAWLAPFAAFMAARIAASAFAPFEQWLYPLTAGAIGAALWWFRHEYGRLAQQVSALSLVCGLAVGIAWIVTDPQQGADNHPLGTWLAGLPPLVAVGWIAVRTIGSVLLVPVAEELAFRGYLCPRLETWAARLRLTPGRAQLLAIVASSLAFGLLHERVLAAALAGAVYAALMYRTGRLSDPIAAHMASNAAISFWSIAAGQWTLL